MARPSAYPIVDQCEKLALMAAKFLWGTYENWCYELDVQSVSTIASWNKGNGISENYKAKIVKALNKKGCSISIHDFITISYKNFAVVLGIDDPERVDSIIHVHRLSRRRHFGQAGPSVPEGGVAEELLVGEYVGVYLCHSTTDAITHSIAIERFSISKDEVSSGLILSQIRNYVTERSESGPLRNKNGRMVGEIEYADADYTNSIYYLMDVIILESNKIFYGLYTDITGRPVREVFCTKFLLFSWDNKESFPDRSHEGEELYELMLPFVKNDLNVRARLVVEPPPYELRAALLGAVRSARMALERTTL
ncbi:hypothetical protein [Parerythrobacter lacustris]|uniref:Uncharacterized protein n=1 Tax=Parerythrobacter lacustris TaxID=2969984 RepID=A0ABT1XPL8_9SPHN|nr:hypothetical protein [Parerythrobacter lacustris]MCR2833603.1 hypothetical protein [Parerythrobacter lacustris]